MAQTISKPLVTRADEIEETTVKKTGRFLIFFKTEWWETVNTHYFGSEIHVKSDKEIRKVIVNGEEFLSNNK